MDPVLLLLITSVASIICFMLFPRLTWTKNVIKRSKKGFGKRVPQAPGSWPIVGHLHLFATSEVPYKLLGSMADKFGPIFSIKIGGHHVLVVSSTEMAKECLITNDKSFIGRSKSMALELMGYNYANFALGPNMQFWREMRRITALELAPYKRHQTLASLRVSEVKSFITSLYRTWEKNKGSSELVKVDMTRLFQNLIVNTVLKMLFGDRFSRGEQKGDQLKKAVKRYGELLAEFVPSDVFPSLRWLDLGGYEKKMNKTAKEMDVIMDEWLEEHKKNINESKDQVFMFSLSSRVKEELKDLHGFTHDSIVKATCLAIYAGATDATIISLTWALSLLINNPFVLQKAREEIENHVGKERKVEESDLKNLIYLQAVIKETLRLYPSAPLLIPHESIEDCVVGGYTVPKGTRLMVNAWKIQHDPLIWTDPFEFQPERFLTSKKNIDLKGQHFELIPFGSGRRMCLGISLALEDLLLIIASIIHGFEFQCPSNKKVDMTVRPGWTNAKATPLELLVAPRLSPDLYTGSA